MPASQAAAHSRISIDPPPVLPTKFIPETLVSFLLLSRSLAALALSSPSLRDLVSRASVLIPAVLPQVSGNILSVGSKFCKKFMQMDRALDMSLDDLIKGGKTSSSRGRGRGAPRRGRGGRGAFGAPRIVGPGIGRPLQGPLRVNARPSAFTIAKSIRRTKNFPWRQDLVEDSLTAVGLTGMESGTKLQVSNLDRGVSNDDIRELFSEIGELKRYAVHFDKNGQPSGSAEVVYARRSDAFAAMKRYNNVRLDGRPIKIEIVTPNTDLPVRARVNVIGGVNGASTRRVVTAQGRGRAVLPVVPSFRGAFQRARGGTRIMRGRGRGRGQPQVRGGRGQDAVRGRGRGGGRGRWQPKEKSAEELDKELDKYHSEAMETS